MVVAWLVSGDTATPVLARASEDVAVELPSGEIIGPDGRLHSSWDEFLQAFHAAK
jgi:hypothetical protein